MIELPDPGFPARAQKALPQVATPLRNALAKGRAAGAVHGWRPFVVVPTNVSVQIVRQPRRGKCVNCGLRRELYRVSLEAGGEWSATEARCADCWGIRG